MARRKTLTSTEVKARYNKKVYDSIAIRVPKDMAKEFKKKCLAEGVSQAQVIKKAIEDFINK
jgi:predicted DNA-binding protein